MDELIKYCKMFSQKIGHRFTSRTILLTAMTGAAATEIGGRTAAAEFQYMQKKSRVTQQDIVRYDDTRLSIIDEISFAEYKRHLGQTSDNLQMLTECYVQTYGKHHIAFIGDFCQLECVGGDCIYLHKEGIYWEQALNCLVELKGTHRYSKCETLQRIMPELREGRLSKEDRQILNSRVINGESVKMPNPMHVRCATFYNKKQAQINANVFKSYLETYHENATENNIPLSGVIIKAKAKWSANNEELTFDQRKILFEECSEGECKNSCHQRCNPFLCLFHGCHLMYNNNKDVDNGIANGTTCSLQKVYLKHGAKLQAMQVHGYWVNAICINDVDHLELRWEDSDRFQGTFKIFQETKLFSVDFRFNVLGQNLPCQEKMRLTHFPVSLNHATTGHKLQGKTLEELIIVEWSKVKNWAYVVLSRVKTLDGLYLLEPIPDDIDFSPAPEYLDMMTRLRNKCLATSDQVASMKRNIQQKLDAMSYLVKEKMSRSSQITPHLQRQIQQLIDEIAKS